MCTLTTKIQRATSARSPLQIITTADVAGNVRIVSEFLRENGHALTLWNPVLGCKATRVNQGLLEFAKEWDSAYTGDPLNILSEWVTRINTPIRSEVWRLRNDAYTNDYEYVEVEIGQKVAAEEVEARKVHRSLVLYGLETWLDVHSHQFDPMVEQYLWDLSTQVPTKPINIIVLVPDGTKLSNKLLNVSEVIEDKLPDRKELREMWGHFMQGVPSGYLQRCRIPSQSNGAQPEEVEAYANQVVDRLCGISRPIASRTLSRSIIDAAYATTSPDQVYLHKLAKAKAEAIRRSSALEVSEAMQMSDIGGLEELKSWIEDSKVTFTPEAREAGIAPAKGMLLVGPPGTGKSVSAKALAGYLGFPLIMFDMGSVYGSLVGDSEKNMRNALATLEAAAPCVVLIDEFEKGMAGSRGNSTDGGTSQRVYGTLLTWMQERDTTNPVVVVATANDITKLDEAILRKGRFDEIFWVDLPTQVERREILRVHLGKVKSEQVCPELRREVEDSEYVGRLDHVTSACEGFVGAEIAQAIKEAHIRAFKSGERLSVEHIVAAMRQTKPLSLTMKESVDRSREWAKNRLRPASRIPETILSSEESPAQPWGFLGAQ